MRNDRFENFNRQRDIANLIDDNLDGPVGSTSASYGILVLVGRPYQ